MMEITPNEQPLAERLGRLAEWSKIPGVRLPVFGPIPPPPSSRKAAVPPTSSEKGTAGALPVENAPASEVPWSSLVEERKPGSTPLHRIGFRWRTGAYWSYPYAYIGLIECPAANSLIIRCDSSEFDHIEIKGVGLDRLLVPLTEHRIVSLREVDNLRFASEGFTVLSIEVRAKKEKKPRLHEETGLWDEGGGGY